MLVRPGAGRPEAEWRGPGPRQSFRYSDLSRCEGAASGVLLAEPEIEAGDEDDRVRDRSGHPHDARAELLVGQRGNATGSRWQGRVGVEGRGREGENGRQCPRGNGPAEDVDNTSELGEASVEWMLVDHLGPEEDSASEKETVFEMVDGLVAEREVIDGRPMPEPEIGGGENEGADGAARRGKGTAQACQRGVSNRRPREGPPDRERQAAPDLHPRRPAPPQRGR